MSAGIRRHLVDQISIARIVAVLIVCGLCSAMPSATTAQ
jgi:hypothetical protein